jgi:hypothetical protein
LCKRIVTRIKFVDNTLQHQLSLALMKNVYALLTLFAVVICLGMLATMPLAGQAERTGKLIVWGDIAVFQPPPHPENCTVKNRFKRGEPVGFRLYALDGGTNEPEPSAQLVVHITHGGRTIDIPALYRGVPQMNDITKTPMPVRANQWTARWVVPNDAPTGTVRYTVTARDRYGRTTEFVPQGGEPSLLTIVQ